MMPRAAAVLTALFAIGLAFTAFGEAASPLCGGRQATHVSNARVIHGSRGPDVIVGGSGPNEISGRGGNDVICGGGGGDVLLGGLGKDTLDGKGDADRVSGGRGSDEVDGGSGRDRVRGDSGNDRVRGGPGTRDQVDGGMGDDLVDGGRGAADVVIGGVGGDRIDGGPGAGDLASYMNAGGPIDVDLDRGRVTGAERERLVEIEDVLTAPEVSRGGGGTRVELRRGLPGSASLAITGGEGGDVVAVSFEQRSFLVSGGSVDSVQLGSARFTDRCDQVGTAVSCAARITSIHVELGAGDDFVAVDRSVPAGVAVVIEGGAGSDLLRGGTGGDTIYAGDDADPDRLEGGGGNDVLFGVNILHPRRPSGAAAMAGGGGDDLLVGGQPCEGDLFAGGRGRFDSASFARVRNSGTVVKAEIGARVLDPDVAGCAGGWIAGSTEKIEGSTGSDILIGSPGADVLLGRGGPDGLDGRGGEDRCIGGRGEDGARHCEYVR